MRKVFIKAITELAEKDHRIMLLTGDLGYRLMEPFADKFPDRFINAGVAEQNMIGIATGLAKEGFIPFVYSITPFAVLRPYEFIRNGPIYHRLKVRIIGAGSGFDYSHDGISHFAIDDIGVLRVQPEISIFAPADFQQAETIFQKTWDLAGPIYYRLGKDETTLIPGLVGKFEVGEAQVIGNGKDILIISMGSIASEVVILIETLKSLGIECTFLVASSINPPPVNTFKAILPNFRKVMTVEEHYINGGIGSLVSEFVAEENYDCSVVRCGVKKMPEGITGSHQAMLSRYGISSDALLQTAQSILANR
jgi:transketolase